ncbi:MAG: hypothetical protein ACPLZH_03550, partial [Minisyncoccales bacterium]
MKNVYYKATLLDAGIKLHKIRSLISDKKAKKIRKILTAKISYKQKLKKFENYKKDLQEAEKVFKDFIKLLRKAYRYKGYKSLIDEIAEKNNIPKKEIENFIDNSKKIASLLNKKIRFKKHLGKEYWSEHYLPFPSHKSQKEYKIEKIYNIWKRFDPLAKDVIGRIKIIRDKEGGSFLYNERKNIFEIRCDLTNKTIPSIFTFIHELGHARQQMELIKNNRNTVYLTSYQREKYAHEFSLKLAREIAPEDEFWAYIWFKTKDLITNGVFEYLI